MADQASVLETEAGANRDRDAAETAPNTAALPQSGAIALSIRPHSAASYGFRDPGRELTTRRSWTQELARRARRAIPDEPIRQDVGGIVSMARTTSPTATTNFSSFGERALDGTCRIRRVARGWLWRTRQPRADRWREARQTRARHARRHRRLQATRAERGWTRSKRTPD